MGPEGSSLDRHLDGEVLGADAVLGDEEDGALEDINELSSVAGPGVGANQ